MASNYSGGNVGAADAAVLALLADTSRAGGSNMFGGGFGGEGGGFFGGPFANFSSNAVRSEQNTNLLNRNNEDDHFNFLVNQNQSNFNLLNLQNQNNALAQQAQISQLALQVCECCGDLKAAHGRIEGKLDCLEGSIKDEINICVNNQTIVNLQNIISEMRGRGGGGGGHRVDFGPPFGPPTANGRGG